MLPIPNFIENAEPLRSLKMWMDRQLHDLLTFSLFYAMLKITHTFTVISYTQNILSGLFHCLPNLAYAADSSITSLLVCT
jgi:hypothetical protein